MTAAISQRADLLKFLLVVTAFIMPVAFTLFNYEGSSFGEAMTAVTPRRDSYHCPSLPSMHPQNRISALQCALSRPQPNNTGQLIRESVQYYTGWKIIEDRNTRLPSFRASLVLTCSSFWDLLKLYSIPANRRYSDCTSKQASRLQAPHASMKSVLQLNLPQP